MISCPRFTYGSLRRILLLTAAIAVAIALESFPDTAEKVYGDPEVDVTDDAVQTFYQNGVPQTQSGVPHTTQTGSTTTTYQPGISFLPRGAFYPEPCRRPYNFTWTSFPGADSYQLFISLKDNLPTASGDRIQTDQEVFGTSATVEKVPANERLDWYVLPNPWLAHLGDVVGSGTIDPPLPCPPSDPDLPNVVETMDQADFNVAITKTPYHPEPFMNLREKAPGAGHFGFIIDARQGVGVYLDKPCPHPSPNLECLLKDFPEQLFASLTQGGQGYSQRAEIFGWMLDDEPVLRAAALSSCSTASMQSAIDLLTQKYDDHSSATDQAIFHIEGAPNYFIKNHGCSDPGPLWDAAVSVGDAGHHNYYFSASNTTTPIAETMTRQTENALDELKPSWFTTQAHTIPGGYPSPDKLRASVYTAIVHGATGIWYFMMDNYTARNEDFAGMGPNIPASYPEQDPGALVADGPTRSMATTLWNTIADVNVDLKTITSVILAPTSAANYSVFVNHLGAFSQSPVHTMLKWTPGNNHYLFAVNMENSPVDVEFRLALPVATKIRFFDGTVPAGLGNVLLDSLDPFEVQVYLIRYVESADSDGDGCLDAAELNTDPGSELSGGLRDRFNPWDFYDVNGDRVIDLFNDIVGVSSRFGLGVGDEGYDPVYDRGPPVGPYAWNMTAPDGVIDLFNDVVGVIQQFGHDCR